VALDDPGELPQPAAKVAAPAHTVPATNWRRVSSSLAGAGLLARGAMMNLLCNTFRRTGAGTAHNGFAMPVFNSPWFGWWMYNATEPQDLWIDEIAVDFKPIGCALTKGRCRQLLTLKHERGAMALTTAPRP
jgi:hypothetical protein